MQKPGGQSFEKVRSYLEEFWKTGEKRYLGLIYELLKRPLFLHCYGILRHREDAEDVTAEAFLKAFEKIGTFERRSEFYPWLVRIATNLCIDLLRRKRLVQVQSVESPEILPAPPNGRSLEEKESAQAILKAIRKLSARQRRCFSLFYIHGKSYREIAALTGYALSEVRSYIQNGRRNFRRLMKNQISVWVLCMW